MQSTEDGFEEEAALDQGRRRQEQAHRNIDHSAGKPQGRTPDSMDPESNEETPLLADHDDAQQTESHTPEPVIDDFAGLPWYSKPHIFWIIFPFAFLALAFGGTVTPRLNLQLELVCREYFAERQLADPNFVAIPVDFNGGGGNQQCRIAEVQSRVSIFNLWASLIAGLLSALTSPKLGMLSDRYGRKPILIVTCIGTIIAEIITIIAATYPESFPVNWLLVAYGIDGLTGSFVVAMAVVNAYGADCTPLHLRNITFGYLHGCLFAGFALGPIAAGYVVKKTGKIVTIFYILLGIQLAYAVFVTLFVPESVSERRRKLARTKDMDWLSVNLLEPLKILWPTGPGSSSAVRRNLVFLSAVDTIVFGVAIGSITVVVIYVNYQFGWETYESGRFVSIVNGTRVFFLVVFLPALTRWFYRKVDKSSRPTSGSDLFDLTMIRFAVLFDLFGFVGFSLSRRPDTFTLAGVIASVGGIGSPTIQSALTKHVNADQTGQLLGAVGLLHCLARVVAPTVFNGIYAATVGKFTQTVFVCLAALFGIAFLLTWFIKPHVYFDKEPVETEAE